MLSKFLPRQMRSGPDWVFQRSDPMGGASGEAFTNTVQSTGMHPAAVLAREFDPERS